MGLGAEIRSTGRPARSESLYRPSACLAWRVKLHIYPHLLSDMDKIRCTRSVVHNAVQHWRVFMTTVSRTAELIQWAITRVGRVSTVGIASLYGLDGPGIKSR